MLTNARKAITPVNVWNRNRGKAEVLRVKRLVDIKKVGGNGEVNRTTSTSSQSFHAKELTPNSRYL